MKARKALSFREFVRTCPRGARLLRERIEEFVENGDGDSDELRDRLKFQSIYP